MFALCTEGHTWLLWIHVLDILHMDILASIGDNDLYTFHAHTQFCDGHAPMEDFVAEAVKLGFRNLGFSPHSPVPIESPCNMTFGSVDQYLAQIHQLSIKYPAVNLYAGMEIDYLGPEWGPSSDYFRSLPLDFRIGSVHFIPNQEGRMVDIDGHYDKFRQKMSTEFAEDIRYVVDTFFRQSIDMVNAGCFDIIGHFDKIKHNAGLYHPGLEQEPWYVEHVDNLVETIERSGVIVEINTKAWREHQQLFPSQRLWSRLLEARVPIIVNSDAHYPERLNDGRRQALKALDYLNNRQLQREKLMS